MIDADLVETLACPVCLEPGGCSACTRPAGAGHAACAEYAVRVRCQCGGPDKAVLARDGDALACGCCGARYPVCGPDGYVDLVPRADLGAVTHYADHEFQERLGTTEAPPLLSARVKADMMREMLGTPPGRRLLDLGCGAGKLALYAGGAGAVVTGVDLAPYFLPGARDRVGLVRGDLRRLPFRCGRFDGAWSLDVLEHLDEAGVVDVLVEARRALAPDGGLFVYTHAMESSRLASFQRGVNRLAKRLGRAGLVDSEREAMRKSDHVNAIRSHEHFDEIAHRAGLEVVRRRYYNVVFKAVVEDLLLRLYEQWRRRATGPAGEAHATLVGSAAGTTSPEPGDSLSGAARPAEPGGATHAAAAGLPVAPAPGPVALGIGHVLSWILKLDVVLFGGVRTGPFFGLLRPTARKRS